MGRLFLLPSSAMEAIGIGKTVRFSFSYKIIGDAHKYQIIKQAFEIKSSDCRFLTYFVRLCCEEVSRVSRSEKTKKNGIKFRVSGRQRGSNGGGL